MALDRRLTAIGYRWARPWLPYVALAGGIYVGAGVLGAAFGFRLVSVSESIPVAGTITGHSPWFFFSKNVVVAMEMAVGAVLAGVPTVALLGYNGFLLGASVVRALGVTGPVATVAMVVPHAVFELPAHWLASAVAFRGLHVVWRIAEGHPNRTSVPIWLGQTAVALLVVVVLLGVAAVVESRVTIPLARLVVNG